MEQVQAELRAGEKYTHWIWFVFPQVSGLGRSPRAVHYAISSRAEAEAYLKHPVLGPRLVACTKLVLSHEGRSAGEIFGFLDAMKFRSSMTLFAAVSPDDVFTAALDRFFGGEQDPATLARL